MRDGAKYLSIGYVVYKLNESGETSKQRHSSNLRVKARVFLIFQEQNLPDPLPQSWFARRQFTESVYFFTPARSNVRSFELTSGEYLVVPCTFEPDHSGDFLLRVYMERGCAVSEYGSNSYAIETQYLFIKSTANKFSISLLCEAASLSLFFPSRLYSLNAMYCS